VLVVGDDELGVGDDEDASRCRGRGTCGRTTVITWMDVRLVVLPTCATRRAGSVCPGRAGWDSLGTHVPRDFVIHIFIIIFVFYSLKQIE